MDKSVNINMNFKSLIKMANELAEMTESTNDIVTVMAQQGGTKQITLNHFTDHEFGDGLRWNVPEEETRTFADGVEITERWFERVPREDKTDEGD